MPTGDADGPSKETVRIGAINGSDFVGATTVSLLIRLVAPL